MRKSPMQRLYPYRRSIILGVHLLLISLGYLAAYAVRFDFAIPPEELHRWAVTLPWLLVPRLLLFYRFSAYSGWWRYVGMADLVNLCVAVSLSSVLFVAGLFFTGGLKGMPRSVPLLDWVIAIFLSGGIRFASRWVRETSHPNRQVTRGRRTFIIGAGDAGEQLLRQIQHDPRGLLTVVGLIDDAPDLHRRTLHGVSVVGGTDRLSELVARFQVELLAIAIPSAPAETMRRIVARCSETGVECKILPPLQDLLASGPLQLRHLREVQINDLLGRDTVKLDLGAMEREFGGRCVLITGAGGSIGSELARQIARFCPRRIVLLERAESPLYFISREVSEACPSAEVIPALASVTNADRLQEIFETCRPDYVFHAAAYKHVPMLEANVLEGVWNNVVGTLRTARCAARNGVARFVLISTDKAVNPTSILGATKRIAERIALELPAHRDAGTDFRVVRFGNVLGSDGSVLPLFHKQLAAGGPLTVTHPEVKRYFMTIPEAVELVLAAATLSEAARRIAILEMGRQVRILDLAEQLIRLSGFVPYQDIHIKFVGLRPGEKLREELVAAGERTIPTSVDKIRLIERDDGDGASLGSNLRHLLSVAASSDPDDVVRALARLVPEYQRDPAADLVPTLADAAGNGGNGGNGGNAGSRARHETLA
jgi:FlaA1/EpsC-like NDP-sugar epimerase